MSALAQRAVVVDVVEASVLEWAAGLLAAPPAQADIARLQSPEGKALLDAIASEWTCQAAMRQIFAALDPARPASTIALDLSVAYTRLFEAIAGNPAISLYESTYTVAGRPGPGTPRLYGSPANEMRELLQRFGLSIGAVREPPDHLSIELALYAVLRRRGDAAGVALMRERLERWVPAFIDGCVAMDPDGFYGGLAQLLNNLLEAVVPDARLQAQAASIPNTQDGSHYAE
nr:molecular chaperone TorD family protein [uncultured Cupriavidus sp.]